MRSLVCRANQSRGTSEQQDSTEFTVRETNEALRTGTWLFCILSTEKWADSSVKRRHFVFRRSSSPCSILHADISARYTSDGGEVCLVTSTFSQDRHLSFIGSPSLPRQAVDFCFLSSIHHESLAMEAFFFHLNPADSRRQLYRKGLE